MFHILITNYVEKLCNKVDGAVFSVVGIRHIVHMDEHVGGPVIRCRRDNNLRREGIICNIWCRKIRDTEERPEDLMGDFNFVCEDIVLDPFPAHLGGTRLGGARLGRTRIASHREFMDKPRTT